MPILGFWLFDLLDPAYLLSNPLVWLLGIFQVWMLVDAVRREEWMWVVFIVIFPILNAILYFFLVYRGAPSAVQGFELPGTHERKRIRQLQDQIHHLDKPHHYSQLADIYFQQGKLAKAEENYRAAMQRDPEDLDTLAHYGHCLLRLNRAQEGLPLLEKVRASQPQHDYSHTLMALAEAYTALGRPADALAAWKQVLEQHSYPRARVQYAELLLRQGDPAAARKELEELIADDQHAPAFQRRRERVWLNKAKALLRGIR